jgi:hypothetical protein
MAVSLSALRETFKDLKAEQLNDLKGIYDSFVKGNPAERQAAERIAQNVNDALHAFYNEGRLSKDDLFFVLRHAEKGYRALMDARLLRIRRSVMRAFFSGIERWVLALLMA